MLKIFPFQLGKAAAAAGLFDMLNLNILLGDPAITISQLSVLHFGLVYCLHSNVYTRAKEHACSQKREFILP